MEQVYIDIAKMLRAISEPKRLRIEDMLSCGELCASEILEAFHVTQPTLSHDMKVLIEAGIVADRRAGKNTVNSLRAEELALMHSLLGQMIREKPECICRRTGEKPRSAEP